MTLPTVALKSLKIGSGHAVASRIEAFTKLSADDRQAFNAVSQNVRYVDSRRDLIAEGDKPKYVHLILDGWGARYKTLPDGKRQIVSLFLPGDFCDVNVYILKQMDHSIGAITRLKVAMITPDEMTRLTHERPRVTQALWWHELVTTAIQREWTLNLGQRLRTVGLASNGRCEFPLTQNDLGDATGLTPVHVNRTLQELRRDGLIELERRHLHILDIERLKSVSMFNPNYLHLDHEGRHLDANN